MGRFATQAAPHTRYRAAGATGGDVAFVDVIPASRVAAIAITTYVISVRPDADHPG
jgi:hypothetical protein